MGHGADLGTELAADHRLVELLCRRLPIERDAGGRRADLARIAEILARHEAFEQHYLTARLSGWMPSPRAGGQATAVRPHEVRRPAVDGAATARHAGHAEYDPAGAESRSTGPDAADRLVARARLHIRYEEERMLPALEVLADWKELEYLGEQVRAEREREASGRPG
jgi:hypothetical protein